MTYETARRSTALIRQCLIVTETLIKNYQPNYLREIEEKYRQP